ncbi:major facilitator superfamily domain-containing protein [Obelidium mucronatum]|nr:major facilitator superfamily domain-containing protein [Obelidium mucronatum]
MVFRDDISQTYLLLLYVLPEAITESMIDPLIPYLIRYLSFDVPADELEAVVGGRSGLFGGVFYLPLLVTNIFWGTLSDIIGRKPVLIIGLFFSALTTFVLGINTSSFVVALLCRFLAGVFGSNSTVAKGALGEIHLDETGRSWAYSLYGSLYAFSGIVGPLIGGLLVDSSVAISKTGYPYFSACSFGALLCILALPVTHRYFHEPKDLQHAKLESSNVPRSTLSFSDVVSVNGLKHFWTNLKQPLSGGKVMFPILLYVLIAFCNRSWSTLLPLLFAAKRELGGLSFTAFETSFAMTVMACSKLGFQTIFCQSIVTRVGTTKAYCLGMAVIIPACSIISFMGGSSGSGGSWVMVMICMSLFGFVEALVYLRFESLLHKLFLTHE